MAEGNPLSPTFPPGPEAPGQPGREELKPRKLEPRFITTAFELPDCRVVRNLGVVRGLVVRSRSILGNIGAAFQTLLGGNITLYTELCEKARSDAFRLMAEHAGDRGANAIIGMRYDANEVASGVTEVLAYGTAVVVEFLGPFQK